MEQLSAGDIVEVVTPIGHFNTPLDPAAATSYAMIAAGSGITPILSILSTILAVEPRSTVTLIYGNRTVKDIMFLEELEDLKNRYPERFALYHVLSREEQEVRALSRAHRRERLNVFLDQLVRPDGRRRVVPLRAAGDDRVARERVLLERGVDADHVHAELFHAEGRAAPRAPPSSDVAGSRAGAAEVTIILDGRSSTFRRRPGRRAHPRRRAARALRRAVRVQGRCLRHLSREAGQRQRRDGPALRARAARDRRGLRARLPVASHHRRRSSSTSTSDRGSVVR